MFNYLLNTVIAYVVLNVFGFVLAWIGLIDLWDFQTQLVLLVLAACHPLYIFLIL